MDACQVSGWEGDLALEDIRTAKDGTRKVTYRLKNGGVGGVNHCRSHCRLAKLRGLMYGGKYSTVIGFKDPIAWTFILGTRTYKKSSFSTNHSAVFPPEH